MLLKVLNIDKGRVNHVAKFSFGGKFPRKIGLDTEFHKNTKEKQSIKKIIYMLSDYGTHYNR